MTAVTRERPLIAIVYAVPLLAEALAGALDALGECRTFSAGEGDVDGLLRWIRPDAVVVDSWEAAEAAEAWARTTEVPLAHLTLRPAGMRVLVEGTWESTEADGPDEIRDVVAGALHGPGVVRA
jgi:hypothetical protein